MKKVRLAEFTVTVPFTFTFKGENDLDCRDLLKRAAQEFNMRLNRGELWHFDERKLEVTDKRTLYTPEEIKANNAKFEAIFGARR